MNERKFKAISDEVARWGALVEFEQRRKHVVARLNYNGEQRLVFMSATCSDGRRGVLNAKSDVRRELKMLGATRKREDTKKCVD